MQYSNYTKRIVFEKYCNVKNGLKAVFESKSISFYEILLERGRSTANGANKFKILNH